MRKPDDTQVPETTLSFARDIRPLFRESDRTAMLKAFDLWAHDDVVAHQAPIAAQLANGTMPCDGAWPDANVAVFQKWMVEGSPP